MSATDPSYLNTFKDGQAEKLREIVLRVRDGKATPEDVQKLATASLVLLDDRAGAAEYFGTEENQVRHQFLHNNRDDLPLPALEWVARCSRGEEPPYSPEHLEALKWLRDAGQIIGALVGALETVRPVLESGTRPTAGDLAQFRLLDVSQERAELQAKVEPELMAAGLR